MTMARSYIRGVGRRLAHYSEVDTNTGCWEWTGGKVQGGYGRMYLSPKESKRHASQLAHRVSYEVFIGPIPNGLTIDHLCRNPACINPDHLEPVTMRTNIRRGGHAQKTHCKHGHPYDDANTYWMPNGGRDCRKCINRRSKEYRQRKGKP